MRSRLVEFEVQDDAPLTVELSMPCPQGIWHTLFRPAKAVEIRVF